MWLIEMYARRIGFVFMVVGAMLPAGLIALPVGHYFAKLFGWDDDLPMGACFFVVLAAEAYAYDRFQRWRYFRNLKP